MDHIIEHIATALAVIFAGLASWFARKATQPLKQQRKDEVIRQAIATARAHPAKGVPLEATALEYAILIDMQDGKSDFRREELWAGIRSSLASEK